MVAEHVYWAHMGKREITLWVLGESTLEAMSKNLTFMPSISASTPTCSVHGRTSEPLAEGSATWQNPWQNAVHFVA